MKAYISVPYDLFPYFLLFEAKDTGQGYKVCDGLSFDYHRIINRYTKENWEDLNIKRKALMEEKEKADIKFKNRAKELMNSLDFL